MIEFMNSFAPQSRFNPMRFNLRLSVLFVAVTLAGFTTTVRADEACDLAAVSSIAELNETLARRAIDLVERAGKSTWQNDEVLARLVEPEANFALGAGDVGRPLGTGLPALHQLVKLMQADGFRYQAFSGPPFRTDGCAEHQAEVDFIDTSSNAISTVRFTFRNGRVAEASGWQGYESSGAIRVPEPN